MTRIFVSHSSKDDEAVSALSQWLETAQFDDHFVDHLHIPPSADWNATLPREVAKADIMLVYVTRDWLSSSECFAEYRSVYYSGRPVVPLLVTETLKDLEGEAARNFQTLCASVQGLPFGPIPPDPLTDEMLRGSLTLAGKTLRARRRGKLIKRLSIFATIMVVTLAGLAVYFRDYLAAYADRVEIAWAFAPMSADDLAPYLEADGLSHNDRTFSECNDNARICPDMIVLPEGRFRMGSPPDDFPLEFPDVEQPWQEIDVLPGLAVSVTEITQGQWHSCFLSTRLSDGPKCKELPTTDLRAEFPVESVSWRDAQAYVAWLNSQVGGTQDGPYRLLSEAEWEYAARGQTEPPSEHILYSWGDKLEDTTPDNEADDVCHFANARNKTMPENFANASRVGVDCPNNPEVLAQVKSHLANGFGLFDTAGNVAEWVADCWYPSHDQRPTDASARVIPGEPRCERVIKGGSWVGRTDYLRPAARLYLDEDLFGFNIGFRIARDINFGTGN